MSISWKVLGERIAEARREQKLTQLELAAHVRLDQTAITKMESGLRAVDSLELARLAETLRRPISWFVTAPPPSVVSRRAEREIARREDVELEALAQDVEQLVGLGVLQPAEPPTAPLSTLEATEAVAAEARRAAGLSATDPAWELVRVVEKLGLYAFVLPLDAAEGVVEGSYVALARGGVALISGHASSGRRRFTITHELGHHVLADQYAPEWVVGAESSEREKVINAFAIHFLLPRAAVVQRWAQLDGAGDPRGAAITLGVEFGVSWSAACAQIHRVGCISAAQHEQLSRVNPTTLELVTRELVIRDDVGAPMVPPGYGAAVTRALSRGKIGPRRAFELLHGTVLERDLEPERMLPLEAMTAELDPLPA